MPLIKRIEELEKDLKNISKIEDIEKLKNEIIEAVFEKIKNELPDIASKAIKEEISSQISAKTLPLEGAIEWIKRVLEEELDRSPGLGR